MPNGTPKQLANLRPFTGGPDDPRTPEQKVEWGRNAQKYSAEARRKKKRLTDAAKWLLAANSIASEQEVIDKLVELGMSDATNAEAMMVVALRKALRGDVEAMKFVRDTGGEAPKNQVELSGDLDRPVATMDLKNLTNEQLMALAENRSESGDTEADET